MTGKPKREDTAVAVLPAEAEADLPLPEVMAPPRPERSFEEQVREAAEGRRFHVHYQPLFSVPDDRIIGVEALLRWDSDSGRIPPARFVPVLESTGLIAGIGEWVLAEACQELAAWSRHDGPGLLTVHVSAHPLVP